MDIETWVLLLYFGSGFVAALVLMAYHWYVGNTTHVRDFYLFIMVTFFGVFSFIAVCSFTVELLFTRIKTTWTRNSWISDISYKFYIWGQINLFKGRGK